MSERIDINRLAREYGRETVAGGGRDSVLVFAFSREELAAYTRAVMEADAKACWPDPLPDSISPYMQGRIDCKYTIEEMMP